MLVSTLSVALRFPSLRDCGIIKDLTDSAFFLANAPTRVLFLELRTTVAIMAQCISWTLPTLIKQIRITICSTLIRCCYCRGRGGRLVSFRQKLPFILNCHIFERVTLTSADRQSMQRICHRLSCA